MFLYRVLFIVLVTGKETKTQFNHLRLTFNFCHVSSCCIWGLVNQWKYSCYLLITCQHQWLVYPLSWRGTWISHGWAWLVIQPADSSGIFSAWVGSLLCMLQISPHPDTGRAPQHISRPLSVVLLAQFSALHSASWDCCISSRPQGSPGNPSLSCSLEIILRQCTEAIPMLTSFVSWELSC